MAGRAGAGSKPQRTFKHALWDMVQSKQLDEGAVREMWKGMQINGALYCREHLLTSCPICQMAYDMLKDEADEQRAALGIRPSGDPGLDATGDVICWQAKERLVLDAHLARGAPVDDGSSPFKFDAAAAATSTPTMEECCAAAAAHKERAVCTSCAYWACPSPIGGPLTTCSRCKIVKYCGKNCQTADWKWEHKYECTMPTT